MIIILFNVKKEEGNFKNKKASNGLTETQTHVFHVIDFKPFLTDNI